MSETTGLMLQLSAQLLGKLQASARDEGVSVEQLAGELLAEGVVLRAWEILERKAALRGPHQPSPTGGNRYRQHGGHSHPKDGNRRNPTNNNWMEDRAAFLEYVRNQEKRGR